MSVDELPPPAFRVEREGVRHLPNAMFAEPIGFRPLLFDLYVPAVSGPCPVVVYVHGGAWCSGSRIELPWTVSRANFHDRILARGWAVAEVDYRLSAEAPWPVPRDDVLEALRWLRFWAADLGLDPQRFAALGESAGAQLALMAAVTDPASVAAVVDWYGPTDLVETVRTRGTQDPVVSMLGGPGEDLLDRAVAASPLYQVTADCPPVITVHGSDDTAVPYHQSVALAERLTGLGVLNELVQVPGAGHIFEGAPDVGAVVETSLSFVARRWATA